MSSPVSAEAAPAIRTRQRFLGLDGLRAFAVIGVLLFHLPGPGWSGGFLGVDVFFVLSGFLITGGLLAELSSRNRIAFGTFYLRRARRLVPAMLLMVAVTAVLVAVFAPDAARQLRADAIAAVTYTSNWWYIVDEQSYFEATGRPPLLLHLWSLGVEEQFYLVWPLVLLGLYRWRGVRGVAAGAVAGALMSAVWMALVHSSSAVDAARAYFGSDTRATGVLLGAALAAALLLVDGSGMRLSQRGRRVINVAGVVGIAALILAFLRVDETSTALYRGGFLVVAVLSAVVIVAARDSSTLVARALSVKPMVWVGERSYGIYLWHWPLFLLLRPELDIPWSRVPASILAVGLTVAAAALSYRYVEMPVRRGQLEALVRRWWDRRHELSRAARLAPASVGVIVALIAVPLYLVDSPTPDEWLGGVEAVGAGPLSAGDEGGAVPVDGTAADEESDTRGPTSSVDESADVEPAAQTDVALPPVTVVGDSVLLGARGEVARALPGTTIDAAISRQPRVILDRVEERRAAGQLEPVVVVHLGTNGRPYADELREALATWRDLDVVLVNTRAPTEWQDAANQNIAAVANEYDNVTVADWHAASQGRREYFSPDGVHLTPQGASAYAELLRNSVADRMR